MSSSSALASSSIPLSDGTSHPAIAFGTYKIGYIPPSSTASSSSVSTTKSTKDILIVALSTGKYSMLDCAEFYNNEADIGPAINHCLSNKIISRPSLYIASKVWTTTIYNGRDAVISQVETSVSDLKCEYLDLVNVHWPVPNGKHVEAYKALEECRRRGLVKSVGVSNYAVEDYEEVSRERPTEMPTTVEERSGKS